MKTLLIVCIALVINVTAKAQLKAMPDSTKKLLKAEASCGTCNLGLKSQSGCALAVRIDGKSYFVDGTTMDEHGDPHESEGMCEVIRKAEVQGELVNNRFKATYFKVLPIKKPEEEKKN